MKMSAARITLLASLALSGVTLHYFVPQVDVVKAVGTEVKRNDIPNSATDTMPSGRTRDVYEMQAITASGKTIVYVNEDVFPIKKNSSEVQTTFAAAASQGDFVRVRHYGWRVQLFDWYPNALSVRPAKGEASPLPYGLLISLAVIWGGIVYLYIAIAARRKRRIEAKREAARQRDSDERNRIAANEAARLSQYDDFIGKD